MSWTATIPSHAQTGGHTTDDIIPYLDSNRVSARREAAVCLASIAAESPSDAVDAVPGLATIVEDNAGGQQSAVYALSYDDVSEESTTNSNGR